MFHHTLMMSSFSFPCMEESSFKGVFFVWHRKFMMRMIVTMYTCSCFLLSDLCNDCFQRFRFCGDLDCPDWALAEISILSKLVMIVLSFIN